MVTAVVTMMVPAVVTMVQPAVMAVVTMVARLVTMAGTPWCPCQRCP